MAIQGKGTPLGPAKPGRGTRMSRPMVSKQSTEIQVPLEVNIYFGRFELSIQEDFTFHANYFGKNVTFVASKLAARGQFIFCLLFNVYDF